MGREVGELKGREEEEEGMVSGIEEGRMPGAEEQESVSVEKSREGGGETHGRGARAVGSVGACDDGIGTVRCEWKRMGEGEGEGWGNGDGNGKRDRPVPKWMDMLPGNRKGGGRRE